MSLRCGGGVDRARATLTGQRRPCYRPATGRLHRRSCRGTARSRRGRRVGESSTCGCAAPGGSSPAAALPRVGLLLRLRSRGWVFSRCCAPAGGSSPAAAPLWLRGGSVSERASTGGWVRGRVGSRRVARVTQGSAFVRDGSKDAAFATGSRRERSIVRTSGLEGRILRPGGASVCGGWAGLLPLRGPFLGKGESLPLRGPSRRHDASFARHGPREGRIVRGSRAEGEPWPRPADPPEPRPTAPVEALSETTPTRSHSNAAPREHPAAPRRPTRAQAPCSGRGPFGDHTHAEPQRRSTERTPSHSNAAARERQPQRRSSA